MGQGVALRFGILEGAPLQAFVVQGKAVALPQQQFEPVPPPVEENVDVARGRVHAQTRAHQPAQPVETLAHVGGRAVQEVPVPGTQVKQGRAVDGVLRLKWGC